jgi:hypothetical protein
LPLAEGASTSADYQEVEKLYYSYHYNNGFSSHPKLFAWVRFTLLIPAIKTLAEMVKWLTWPKAGELPNVNVYKLI